MNQVFQTTNSAQWLVVSIIESRTKCPGRVRLVCVQIVSPPFKCTTSTQTIKQTYHKILKYWFTLLFQLPGQSILRCSVLLSHFRVSIRSLIKYKSFSWSHYMDSLVLSFHAVYWMHDFTGRKIGDILLRWQKYHLQKSVQQKLFFVSTLPGKCAKNCRLEELCTSRHS